MSDSNTIIYVISCYPAVSHTFIQQEIAFLRQAGKKVVVASINNSNIEEMAKSIEVREEEKNTFYIKEKGVITAIDALFQYLIFNPVRFFQALSFTWKYIRQTRRSIKYLFGYFGEALLLARWFSAQNSEQVHAYFGNVAATVAMIAKRLQPFKLSLSIHGPDIFYDETMEGLPIKVQDADWIRCISFYSQSQILKHLKITEWEKLHIVRMGVDVSKITPLPSTHEKSNNPRKQIVTVGRLVPVKGFSILIQAIANLKEQGKFFELTLIGSGPERAELEELAMRLDVVDEIRFKGPLSHHETLKHMQHADLFVLATFAEGIPIVLMEAMAMKIPCISTWINGTPELIRNGIDGILVAPSDVISLQNAIAHLSENAELQQKIVQSGRQRIEDEYNLEKNTKTLSSLF
ncbi:MAG: glycosyltransferase family 4 protein [Parachlamydiales bacterium]